MSGLAVVTAYWNPCRWQSRLANYRSFAENIRRQGVPLFVVEVACGRSRFQLSRRGQVLRLRAADTMWHGESAANVMMRQLWNDFDAIAWVDADVLFKQRNWADETLRMLDRYPVVQCYETVQHERHFAGGWPARQTAMMVYAAMGEHDRGTQGSAWAVRSELLRRLGGLLDVAPVGGADRLMAFAFAGRMCETPGPWAAWPMYPPGIVRALERWAAPIAGEDLRGGFVPGVEVLHLYHGTARGRRYAQRWHQLLGMGYDPALHLERADNGLWRWSDAAPIGLRRYARRYFRRRREDG